MLTCFTVMMEEKSSKSGVKVPFCWATCGQSFDLFCESEFLDLLWDD